jgi:hypothetical protein
MNILHEWRGNELESNISGVPELEHARDKLCF